MLSSISEDSICSYIGKEQYLPIILTVPHQDFDFTDRRVQGGINQTEEQVSEEVVSA